MADLIPILRSLHDSKWRRRTPVGVAKECGLSEDEVLTTLAQMQQRKWTETNTDDQDNTYWGLTAEGKAMAFRVLEAANLVDEVDSLLDDAD